METQATSRPAQRHDERASLPQCGHHRRLEHERPAPEEADTAGDPPQRPARPGVPPRRLPRPSDPRRPPEEEETAGRPVCDRRKVRAARPRPRRTRRAPAADHPAARNRRPRPLPPRDLPPHRRPPAEGRPAPRRARRRQDAAREVPSGRESPHAGAAHRDADRTVQELKLPFISVSAPSIVSGMSGESEKTLRDTFDEAKVCRMRSLSGAADAPTQKVAPCILFLDEVDAITPKRENAQREMERRIVAQLLTCMDDLAASEEPVIIIGATNRPDSLDPALRRAGRFDHEIEMGVPSQEGREQQVFSFYLV